MRDWFAARRKRRHLRDLRRSCTARLGELDLDHVSSVVTLCEKLSRQRGRPIHLIPAELKSDHPCGMWIALEGVDFIVYEANTSKPHQEHIIAHELAHMICCHRGGAALDEASARLLFPNLDPRLVQDMLRRTGYSDEQEQEAELLATLLLQQITAAQHAPTEAMSVVRRIKNSLS
ncbi:hypothetical protein Lesp02_61380 [Lentzea sp. NBRC 105346]|uniref:toxin n=1 Tax=Lentzea sp. NBRC 105346 TaxID=3032205 RepID=UPI00255741C6|nr:toxin [Lentzea sp. NBRC 105346]GLZ33950.1 hypothetical protein Lesp02_61380 [Lentzea sp. NBRC 105346]